MNKIALFCVLFVMVSSLSGCTNGTDHVSAISITEDDCPSDAAVADVESQNNDIALTEEANDDTGNNLTAEEINDDFIELEHALPIDEFADMLVINPEKYLGTTVKVSGDYSGQFNQYEDKYYHFLIRMDELGCCPYFMEFVMNGDYSLDDFPEENTPIEITGMYKSYFDEEYEWTFYYVEADSLTILDEGRRAQ